MSRLAWLALGVVLTSPVWGPLVHYAFKWVRGLNRDTIMDVVVISGSIICTYMGVFCLWMALK